ncbi:MAG: DUF92 domain-containing protein [Thermoanaerobaculia bacterium]
MVFKSNTSENYLLRKTIHILMGFFILALKFLNFYGAALCALSAFLFNLFILPFLFPSIFRKKKDPGILIYPLSVLALIILYPKSDFIVGASWALMAFGDGFATIFGKTLPLKKLFYNSEKSFGGFLGFLIFGVLSVYLFSLYFNFKISPFLIILITFITAFIETLNIPLIDNISVPLFSSFLFYILTPIKTFIFPPKEHLIFSILLVFLFSFSIYLLKIIKFSAFTSGFVFGTIIFYFSSFFGFLSIILFFIIGTALTFWGFEEKKNLGIEEKDGGRRGASNVIANLIFPLFLSIFFQSHPDQFLIKVLFLSAVSTALSDTAGTEFGKLFGKSTFNPLNFKKAKRGEEGAVSLEGLFGSLLFPLISNLILYFLKFIDLKITLICTFSGFFGSISESYIKRLGKWEHSFSNFANTVIGSAIGGILWALIK